MALAYIEALGGVANIEEVDACITRLRLVLKDTEKINEVEIKKLGSTGVLKASDKNAQIIIGTRAEIVAEEINNSLNLLKNK